MTSQCMALSEVLGAQLSAAVTGHGEATLSRTVGGLSQDSRRVRPGDCFIALGGAQCHGLDHAEDALAAGAVAVLYEPAPGRTAPRGVPAWAVPGLRDHLGALAGRFYGQPSRQLDTIGITGTDGKTSTAQFLTQALTTADATCGVIGTLGAGVLGALTPTTHTTPDAIGVQAQLAELLHRGAEAVVMEVSSHALDQGRVNGVCFDTAVLTNVTRDHLDYHGSMAAYAAAKRRLFRWDTLAHRVVNADDAYGAAWLPTFAQMPTTTVAYSLRAKPAVAEYRAARWLQAVALTTHAKGLHMVIDGSWGRAELASPLLGRFNAANLLAALAVLLVRDLPLPEALARLSRVAPAPGRMAVAGGAGKPTAVIDYAHTPAALTQVLAALRTHCDGRLHCVFGCGGDRDRGKRAEMGRCAAAGADRVVLTDDNPRFEDADRIIQDIMQGLSAAAGVTVERDRGQAIAGAIAAAAADDIVLVAGKGHETGQIYGAGTRPFSDAEAVNAALAGWAA